MAYEDYVFKKNRNGLLVGKYSRECFVCHKMFNTSAYAHNSTCKECRLLKVKKTPIENQMLQRARKRANAYGVPMDITYEDIKIPEYCPILNIKLQVNERKRKDNSPSLDRIDPIKGYTKDNIQVISNLANQMKSSANPEQLLKFADWIYRTYRKPA